MYPFEEYIPSLLNLCEEVKPIHAESLPWPRASKGNIVLKSDTALELGGPGAPSLSMTLWTKSESIKDSIRITGPDIQEIQEPRVPFALISIINAGDVTEENAFDRSRNLDMVRYSLLLEGFMYKGTPRGMNAWSRISRKALEDGFSLAHLGSALIKGYHSLDFVNAAAVMLITGKAVETAIELTEKPRMILGAMRKMAEELSFDCGDCDYNEVCSEADILQLMRSHYRNSSGGKIEG
jgi:CO dehydrogenase/acetyl-CoA synthase beta subunit